MSGLGKGITAASIGRLLMNRGYKVTAIKIDPYINIDAGLMSPFQHGEVYVLKDGGEVDLDLGNYERFLDVELTRDHNITTGKVYSTVIEKERRGEYLGKTVQIIPHITEEIKRRIRQVSRDGGCEICLIEVGGTVGDIESMPFLEAMRQLKYEESGNIFFVHVTLAPSTMDGEQKTKPTQHSVKEMRQLGLQPDMIVVRCERPLLEETKHKIAHFCDVPMEAVISAHNSDDIYRVPLQMEAEGLARYLMKAMRLFPLEERKDWDEFVQKMDAAEGRRLFAESLPEHLAAVTGPDELEGMRRRLLALPAANGAALRGKDFLAAIGIFLLVVIATFPVVVPFMLADDVAIAMRNSRIVTLGMLFLAGYLLGRYASHPRPGVTGLATMLLGAVLIVTVMALGG